MALMSEIRDKYPQYEDLTDKELADGFHNKFYSDIPIDDFYRQVGVDTYADERTLGGSVAEFAKGIPREFAGAFLSAGEGVAELADAGANALGFDDLIDSGDDNELVRLSREGRKSLDASFLGGDVAYQDQWSTKLGGALGSFASFLTPTVALKLAGVAGKGLKTKQTIAGLGLGGFGKSGESAQRVRSAREQGIEVSEGQEDAAVALDFFNGLTEMAPVNRVLSKISKFSSKKQIADIKSLILSGLGSGTFEGFQELGSHIASNAIERGIYNENLAVDDSLYNAFTSDEFTLGASVGFLADVVLSSAAIRRRGIVTKAETDREGELRVKRDERIALGEEAVSKFQAEEAQGAEQRAQEEQGLDFQPSQATVDPSQIDPPTPEQITKKLRRAGRYLQVTDATDPNNIETYQAEEKVRRRTVKRNTIETRYIVDVKPDGTTQEKTISKNGIPNPDIVVQEIASPSERVQPVVKANPPIDYSNHIFRVMGRSFPTAGSFQVDMLPSATKSLELQNARKQNQGESDLRRLSAEIESLKASELASGEQSLGANQVVHITPNGKKTPFGRNVQSLEEASLIAGRLNEKIVDSQVNNSVTQVINNSTESYSPEVKSTLVTYGDTILHPDESTFTASAIDSAAGTIAPQFQENASAKDLVMQGVSQRKMTASQKLNAKRIAKGLPETNTFTPAEAKSVLKDKFSRLIRPPETLENAIYKAVARKNKKKKDEFVLVSGNGDEITTRPPTADEAVSLQERTGRYSKYDGSRNVKFKNVADAKAYAEKLNSSTKSFIHMDSVLDSGDTNAKLSVVADALQKNNIVNEIGSPAIRVLAENFTGVKATGNRRISDMNQGELKALVSGIRSLPRFDAPTKLPLFKHNRYTSDQFGKALEFVKQNDNDTTNLEGIAQAIGLDFRLNPQALKIAEVLGKDLKDHIKPVQNMPKLDPADAIPQGQGLVVYQEPKVNLNKFMGILKSRMKSVGLEDMGLNLNYALQTVTRNQNGELVFGVKYAQELNENNEKMFDSNGNPLMGAERDNNLSKRTEAFYSPDINGIFLAVDSVNGLKNMSEQQQEAEFIRLLDHEMIHGMRQLDLWTEKEWRMLSSLVGTKTSSKGGTFLDNAIKDYGDKSRVVQIEEAVAEMTREARLNKKLLTGRPRTSLNKITSFFTKVTNAIKGFGFNSFDNIITGIESGEIGSRETNKIRTLLETERLTGTPSFDAQGQSRVSVAPSDETEAVPVQDGQRMGDFANVDSTVMESRAKDPYDFGYRYSEDRLPAFRGASELKEIRNTFLNDVTNAGFQSGDLIFETELDLSKMSPQGRSLLKALEKDNFLGFERYDDAFLALFNEDISNYDPSQGLKSALGRYVKKEYETGFSTGRGQAKEFLSEGSTPKDSIPEISEEAINKVVEKNVEQEEASTSGFIPKYSSKAEPRAQYVAQNPEKGAKLSTEDNNMYSRANEPEYSSETQKEIDKLVTKSPDQIPNTTYLEVTNTGSIGAFFTKAKTAMINKWTRLEDIYKLPQFRDLLADSGALQAAMMAEKHKAVTSSALTQGSAVYKDGHAQVEDFVFEGKKYRGLIEVLHGLHADGNQYNVNLEQLTQAYMIAKRSVEQRKRGLKTPADENSLAILEAEVNKYVDENGNSIIKEFARRWDAYNRKTVKFLQDTGVLDAETSEIWLKDSDYVPFYRQVDDPNTADNIPRIFSGMTSASTFKKLKGSESAVTVPLLEAIVRNLDAAIAMGMRNVAQQRIVRDLNSLGLAREVKAGEKGTNVINFKVDGKKRSFSIDDPLMFQAMESSSISSAESMITSVVGAPATALRELITRDPGFMIVNLMRDTLSTAVTSGASIIPVLDTVKNFNRSSVEELSRYGVVGGYDLSNLDYKNVFEKFKKESKKMGLSGASSQNIVMKMWDYLGAGTTMSDAATRKAVFDDVLKRTGNSAEAAWQASEIINFGRRGNNSAVRIVTAAIPFLNARFQGLDVFWRAAQGNYSAVKGVAQRRQAINFLVRGAFLAGLTALYWHQFSDDEQYKEANEHTRDNYWLIPTPWGVPFKVPIPFEVGLIFKVIPERILGVGSEKTTGKEAYESLKRGAVGTLGINPLGAQIIKPMFEVMYNKNTFTGAPVVPPYMVDDKLEGFAAGRITTSELAKWVGTNTNTNPLKIEHIIKGYTGTIGSYGLMFADALMRTPALTGDKSIEMPSRPMFEYPIIKRFFNTAHNSGAKEDFYELNAEIKKTVNTLGKLAEDGRMAEYEKYLKGRETLVGMASQARYIEKQLKLIRNHKDNIRKSELSPSQKEETIADLELAEKEILKGSSMLRGLVDQPFIDTLYK